MARLQISRCPSIGGAINNRSAHAAAVVLVIKQKRHQNCGIGVNAQENRYNRLAILAFTEQPPSACRELQVPGHWFSPRERQCGTPVSAAPGTPVSAPTTHATGSDDTPVGSQEGVLIRESWEDAVSARTGDLAINGSAVVHQKERRSRGGGRGGIIAGRATHGRE
jgi:hypothetical protein